MPEASNNSEPSMAPTLLALVVGAAAGYTVRGSSEKSEAPDPMSDAVVIANMQERISLLEARNDALNALNVALKDQSATGQTVVTELQATVNRLNEKLAASTVLSLSGFPAVFGTGDPSVAGFVKGRSGMLISRVLSNFLPPAGTQLSQGPYDLTVPVAGFFQLSDPTRSLAPKSITIGRSVNNSLAISMRNGIYPGMAVILNFEEDVADDTDFVALGSMHAAGYYVGAYVIPMGRKSLMLVLNAPLTLPAGYTLNQWMSNITRDTSIAGVANPTVAQRTSYGTAHCVIKLSHRSARSLTLRSWNIVSNPLAQYASSYSNLLTDVSAIESTLSGPCTVVRRINTSPIPKFYLPDEVGEYNAVDLSAASYM